MQQTQNIHNIEKLRISSEKIFSPFSIREKLCLIFFNQGFPLYRKLEIAINFIKKKENLDKALAYLTKQDSIAKLKIGNRRTFFKGCLPKRSAKSGRKRSRNV